MLLGKAVFNVKSPKERKPDAVMEELRQLLPVVEGMATSRPKTPPRQVLMQLERLYPTTALDSTRRGMRPAVGARLP